MKLVLFKYLIMVGVGATAGGLFGWFASCTGST
jgi:hypothetical protein